MTDNIQHYNQLVSFVLIFLLLFSSSCRIRFTTDVVERVEYIRDQRTGLCFAVFTGDYGKSITTVPCEKVNDFIIQEEKDTVKMLGL